MTASRETIDHEAVREYLASVLPERMDEYDQSDAEALPEMARVYLETLASELSGDKTLKTMSDYIRYDVDAGTWEWRTWQRAEMLGAWLDLDPETLRDSGEVDTLFRNVIAAELLQIVCE